MTIETMHRTFAPETVVRDDLRPPSHRTDWGDGQGELAARSMADARQSVLVSRYNVSSEDMRTHFNERHG